MVVCPRSGSFILFFSIHVNESQTCQKMKRRNNILDDLDVVGRMHATHRPGRDEDELLADGVSSGFNLCGGKKGERGLVGFVLLRVGKRGINHVPFSAC